MLRPRAALLAALAVLGATPVIAPPPTTPTPAVQQGPRPCDLFAQGGTPCVAAHSTVRGLFSAYTGPLYAVKRVGNDGCGKGPSGGLAGAVAAGNASGGLCGCTPDGKSVTLTCPAGGTVTAVTFASIGTPAGACGNLTEGSCRGTQGVAKAAVEKLCLGKNSCTVVADIQHMNGGADPCYGVPKSIAVELQCSTPVPASRGDGKTLTINASAPGAFADSGSHDAFCAGTKCVFWTVFDQTPNGNHLQFRANAMPWTIPADASADPLTVGGHKVYGLRSGGEG